MEEFWKGIDTPAKHPSERGLKMLPRHTLQDPTVYEDQHHDIKQYLKAADQGTSSNSLKVEFLEIPLSEISEATDNFTKGHIGSGGYADVYKGELNVLDIQSLSTMQVKCKEELPKIRKTVAIKRINNRADEQGKKGFETEIELLTSCKHPNVVTLHGFCRENDELILVYEFIFNGSLGDYLIRDGKKVNLTWAQRLQICLDTANGINYLHTDMKGKRRIIHRDIKSDNILLDENLNAKVADFGLSKFQPMKQQVDTIRTKTIAGTEVYMDPEYWNKMKYKRESDIYSFGVVLFEVLSGRLAYDPFFLEENRMGLAPIAKRHVTKRTLNQLIDPKLIEDAQNYIFTLNREISQDHFDAFSEIACQCLADAQDDRPKMKVIIKELQNALNLQQFKSATSNFSTILSATNNFSDENLLTGGSLGKLYKGQLLWNGNLMNFTVRRLARTNRQGDELQTEISTLKSLKHKNIMSVLGHYDTNDEKIIIYEQAFNGSLDQHLSDPNLTCSQRLQICLGVAHALNYIQYDVIHSNINPTTIFLDQDWEPKIYCFELSTKYPQSWKHRLLYSGIVTPKHDVYLFGKLLLHVLYGMKPMIFRNGEFEVDENIIDSNLKKKMGTEALKQFKSIVDSCLKLEATMDKIVNELGEVSQLQWEHAKNLEHSKAVDEDEDEDEDEGRSSNTLKTEWLKIPLSEIRRATNDFDESYMIGSGGYGIMYKAKLDVLNVQGLSSLKGECKGELPKIRKIVAIKRYLRTTDLQDDEIGFLRELEMLSSCKHPNIVSLFGFSVENNEHVIVYEYASKGSLSDCLRSKDKRFTLTWAQRLQICLNVANGINYLHTDMKGKPRIIHRDIKSDNILLDENLNTKLADFGFSKFHHRKKKVSDIYSKHIVGTMLYVDPEYLTTGKYNRGSDIYSFGVVLFEVLSGRVANDSIYTDENEMGLAPIARRRFKNRTLKELIDPEMIKEDSRIFILNKAPNQNSFEAFSKIAYRCLAETQAKRPTMEVVISELQNALKLQEDTVVLLKFLLQDIELATKNFAETYCIGLDTNGTMYKAELHQFVDNSMLGADVDEPSKKRNITVAIKRITSRKGRQGKQGFLEEFEMRAYKHPNIVSLLGFCEEGDEMILVYEHVSGRSLDEYLKSVEKVDAFTWTHRLLMCLEIARGLDHLHTKMAKGSTIHTDIRSANIMLEKDGKAKIGYFVITNLHPTNDEGMEMKVYEDPEFETTGKMKKECAIYSFGVVLFEIFCGRVAYDSVYTKENEKGLAPIARQCCDDGTIERLMDLRLKKETGHADISALTRRPDQDSLEAFLKIAYTCLGEAVKRPTMEMVIKELERALNFHDPKHVDLDD